MLGEGASGSVYRVVKAGLSYAMKVISRKQITDIGDKRRLQREIDTMTHINYPFLVAMHDFFSDADNFYLIMDYCQGGDLYEHLKKRGGLREAQAATIFKQIVMGVAFLHAQGVAHRDLKPHNILFTSAQNVKVGDFGLCGYIESEHMNTFCGSPCYTAPECLRRIEYNGCAADVWSLGVLLYEMVTGHHPWDVTSLPRMVQQICAGKYACPRTLSSSCQDLLERLLTLSPTKRITTSEILAHPWLRLASARAFSLREPLIRRSALVFKLTRTKTDPHTFDKPDISKYQMRKYLTLKPIGIKLDEQ